MRAFIFILHTPDTFCITFVQIASFFIQTFLLILCEKRSSCGLDDVGCGWLGPSQEEGGGGRRSCIRLLRICKNSRFYFTVQRGTEKKKNFYAANHARYNLCMYLAKTKKGTPSCCSLLGFWVFCVHFHPAMCIYFCNFGMTTSAFSYTVLLQERFLL